LLRGAHRFSQDLAAAPNTGTKQIPVAKGLGALAEGSVQLALFHPFRPDGDQPERDGVLPVLIETGEESLAVGATIELGNVMREGAILQVRLVTAHEHPIAGMPKQRPAFRGVGRALFGVRNLGNVWREMLRPAVRRTNVNERAVDAAVVADVLEPCLLSACELSDAPAQLVVFGEPAELGKAGRNAPSLRLSSRSSFPAPT